MDNWGHRLHDIRSTMLLVFNVHIYFHNKEIIVCTQKYNEQTTGHIT